MKSKMYCYGWNCYRLGHSYDFNAGSEWRQGFNDCERMTSKYGEQKELKPNLQ